ncbi:MAG: ATP-binding protein [bacterium]|nr:ATP-binding protein [bacterium]
MFDQLKLQDRAMGASSCGITIADARIPDMPLIYINEAFTRITGYTAAETLGRNCRFLQLEDRHQPALDSLRAALHTPQDCRVVIRNYRKDGTLFWNELFTSPVFDDDGRVTHFVGVQTDVTDRVTAEAELLRRKQALEQALDELRDTQAMLIHSEKMNALGQLVAGVAHEINNPISFVNSNLYSLQTTLHELTGAYDQLEALIHTTGTVQQQISAAAVRVNADLDFLHEDVEDLVNSSLKGLGRVRKIVEALRTFSHLDEAELKVTNLLDDIQSTLVLARLELKDRVQVMLDIETLPPIKCHPAELNQVFLNLIVNAAQAIPETGRLTIRGRDEGDHIRLDFIDTGIGMSPDVMTNIFHPFYTTKPVGTGTGLGLAIAHKIITVRHRGTITVQSEAGKGSTFTLRIPKDL